MIKKILSLLTYRDKQMLIWLIWFSILISIIETVGISAIMPFIAVVTDFTLISSDKSYHYVYKLLHFKSDVSFVIFFGVILIGFYIFRSFANLIYFYSLNRFTHGRYHLIASRLFENYMAMSYRDFTNKNSSVLTKSIVNEAMNLTVLISSFLLIMGEIFVVIFIYSMLLYVNCKITILLTVILIINAVLMIKTVSVKIKKAGAIREEFQRKFYEIINRSFGNFKLIKLRSNDKEILGNFSKASFSYAKANVTNATISQIPRLFLEAVGFSIIVFIVIYLIWKNGSDVSNAFSIISMFVLALYRLMPSVNRIMNSYNQILFYFRSLDIVYDDLMYDSEKFGDIKIEFINEIILKGVGFEYQKDMPVLKDINFIIPKGSNTAFVGESGSGKSTIVDIIIGLYKPHEGAIYSDNQIIDDSNIKAWRKKVGYIPQIVYLFDGTVGQNVSFGAEYEKEKVDICLKKAKIYNFLMTKKGQDTLVGEGGIMLSGGQKQRIAIARALYIEPEIIVFDEATSALDAETEKEIMDEIYAISKNKTLIIIAHRLSTIDRCERRYRLENGNVCEVDNNV